MRIVIGAIIMIALLVLLYFVASNTSIFVVKDATDAACVPAAFACLAAGA